MLLLSQFLFRLSFGMAAAMALVSPRLVSSGYYRNNFYVLLGMNALAAPAAYTGSPLGKLWSAWPAVAAAIVSYFGAAFWLYEKPRPGVVCLWITAALNVAGSIFTVDAAMKPGGAAGLLYADAVTGGCLLGVVTAAMLLGHWYLNAPGMQIRPLRMLVFVLMGALAARVAVIGWGFFLYQSSASNVADAPTLFIAFRWLAGIVGTAVAAGLTWSILKIPNTQAATGMLYVAVITAFLGELAGQLLSASAGYPL